MALITLQYFFILAKSLLISFLPVSSDHFKEALVKAFFLARYLVKQNCTLTHHGGEPPRAENKSAELFKHQLKDWGRREELHDNIGSAVYFDWRSYEENKLV